jgi:predicted ATPase
MRQRGARNPFLVQESVLALVEGGALVGPAGGRSLGRPAATNTLPATVQAVLATRIDRLADSDEAVLCVASVTVTEVPT